MINEQKILEEIEAGSVPVELAGNSAAEISAKLWDYWEGLRDGKIRLIPALPLFAEKMPYYMLKKLMIIGGYTSAGKSTLVSQMTADICRRTDAKVDIISVEDSKEEKLMSLIAVVSDVGKKRLVTGDIFGENNFFRDKVVSATGIVQGWPVRIYDDKYTLRDIETVIKNSDAEINIIDYVQNMAIPGNSLYERMSRAAVELFRMCKDYNKMLIVLSQVSNESARNESDVIGLKGAGELAAAADVVAMIKKGRSEENKREVEIDFSKNRLFGETGKISCVYSEHWTRIENPYQQSQTGERTRYAD